MLTRKRKIIKSQDRPKKTAAPKPANIISLLNQNIDQIETLSTIAKAGLKKLGIETIGQFRTRLNSNNLNLHELGLKTREELRDLLRQNGIKTKPNWVWGL